MPVVQPGLFFFGSAYRPVPLSQTFIGVPEANPVKRKLKMNEICFQKVLASVKLEHQAMVFVHSRKDTVKSAEYLVEAVKAGSHQMLFAPDEHPKWAAPVCDHILGGLCC